MSQLNDISLVAQVVVFRNTRAFDQLVGKYQSSVRRPTWPRSKTYPVSLPGSTVLLIMYFMIIFAPVKRQTAWKRAKWMLNAVRCKTT